MTSSKRQCVEEPAPEASFRLIAEIMDAELPFYDLIDHLPAATSATLAKTDKRAHALLLDPATARWCARSRRKLLEQRAVPGDLPLAPAECEWTLERLHLCERPPRFPHIYFKFADDGLDASEARKVGHVAALLRRHPRLRLRVHGFAQPEAPSSIGEALAQARATSVRKLLLTMLEGQADWANEDPSEGVRTDRGTDAWLLPSVALTRVVGARLQAVGRWPHTPENRNFVEQADMRREHHRLRRAEFTLLGLASC